MKSVSTIVSRSVLVIGLGLTVEQSAVAQYSKTILADKPVAYYRLGEQSGSTVALDSSPNGLNGTYEGSPQLGVPGLINAPNTAADFTNGDVVIDDNPSLDFVSLPFSIEAWINVTQLTLGGTRIFDKVAAGTPDGYGINVGPQAIGLFGSQNFDAAVTLTLGNTYHIVGVSDGKGKGFMYLNGVLVGSGAFMSANPYSGPAHVGVASDGTYHFQGVIDEVAIYNKALSASRILAHYNIGTGVKLSPKSLSFGNQLVGTTSTAKIVTLTNVNSATLNISAVAVTGDFAQTNDCPASLLTNAHCTITVSFTPTAKGVRVGAVSVTDNFPGSPQLVSLKGKGI